MFELFVIFNFKNRKIYPGKKILRYVKRISPLFFFFLNRRATQEEIFFKVNVNFFFYINWFQWHFTPSWVILRLVFRELRSVYINTYIFL